MNMPQKVRHYLGHFLFVSKYSLKRCTLVYFVLASKFFFAINLKKVVRDFDKKLLTEEIVVNGTQIKRIR